MSPAESLPTSSVSSYRADAKGAWRAGETRVAALTGEALHALHSSIIEQFGDHAADVLYRCGYESGLQQMVDVQQRLRVATGSAMDPWQTDRRTVLESWWAPQAEGGWGRCTFDATPSSRGLVFVELQSSAVAAALGASDEPLCHLYAGMFAAALSFLERSERHAVELECVAVGTARCFFAIGSAPDIDSAEAWRQQKVLTSEIVRRLR